MHSLLPLLVLATTHAAPQVIESLPPRQASPQTVQEVARSLATARDPALEDAEVAVRTAGLGQTVLVFRHTEGIRAQSPDMVVRFDESGAPRVLAYRPRTIQHVSSPPLTPREVRHAVLRQLPLAEVQIVGPLRWWSVDPEALLPARAVVLRGPWRGLTSPVAIIRQDGLIVDILDDSTHGGSLDHAQVYLTDPVDDPTVERVRLPEFGGADSLHSRHFEAFHCRDKGDTYSSNSELGEVELRQCTPHSISLPGPDGWLFDPIPYPSDPAADEDRFAGPQLVWHGEKVVEMLVELGLPIDDVPRDWTRLAALNNMRTTDLRDTTTMSSPDAPLETYDNAYFRRARESDDGSWTDPEVVFGQGSVIDFAYDADVITHELGHWAVWMQSGPSSVRYSPHGSSAEPGALNEGLADYFAAVRMNDPIIGLYSGEGLGRPYIRTLDGDARCPDSIYGQVHADSQPFSQALWGFRTSLPPEEQEVLDRAVMDALPVMGTQSSFADAVTAIVTETDLQLSPDAASSLRSAFSDRQVDACTPHLLAQAGAVVRSYSRVPAFYAENYDQAVPGYLQFVIEAEGPIEVTVDLMQTESTDVDIWGTNEPQALVVLASSGEPIVHSPYRDPDSEEWVWAHNAAVAGEVTWAEELETSLDGRTIQHAWSGTFTLQDGGPHYLQLANLHPRIATAYDLTFDWQPVQAADDTGIEPIPELIVPKKECGCSATFAPSAGMLGVVLLGLARRRTHWE